MGVRLKMGLEMVEIVMIVEDTFDIQLSDDDLGTVKTVGDLDALIQAKVIEKNNVVGKEFKNSDEVWDTLKRIIAETLCVPPEKVTPQARLLQDLGAG